MRSPLLLFLFSIFQCAKASDGLQNEWWFWVIICLCILGISACAVEYLLSPGNYHQNEESDLNFKIELATPTPSEKKKKKRRPHEHRKQHHTPMEHLPKPPKPPHDSHEHHSHHHHQNHHPKHTRRHSHETETTVATYEPPKRYYPSYSKPAPRPMYYDYHPTYSYNFYGGSMYPPGPQIQGKGFNAGMPPPPPMGPSFFPPPAHGKYSAPRPAPTDPRVKRAPRRPAGPQPRQYPTTMYPPPYMGYYPPNYPIYRAPPHQREMSANYGSVRSGHSSHFSVSRATRNIETSINIQDQQQQQPRVNKKLVDIDERHPVPDNRVYRKQQQEEHRHRYEPPEEHQHRYQPPESESDAFIQSSEDVAEIIPEDFHPGRIHISPVDLRGVSHKTPTPVTSPVAAAFEHTEFDDDKFFKELEDMEKDREKFIFPDELRDFNRLSSGFRKSPAIIQKQIEASRSKYGYGIKADKQVMKYLMNTLNLKNMKYAKTLLRMYDNNTLHHIEAPHHPAPSKPLPGHRRKHSSETGSLSDELFHIDEDLYGGDNFQLHSDSESSGSHDPSKWHDDPKFIAASWKKESVIEVFSKLSKQWLPAMVVEEFDSQGEKWLGMDVMVHGDEHIYKEVKRFGDEVRSLGVSQLEQESVEEVSDPNHELLIMHGLLKNPRRSDVPHPHKQHEIVISAHGAGSEIINGRYIWQHEGCYAHKLHRNIELHHDIENHLWMFTCTTDHHNYYFAHGNDGSDVPPVNGYNALDGKMDPPILEIFTTEEHEDIESSSESDSEFIINNDFMELTFKLKAENVHDLGVEWSHTPNEKHLILWDVPAGSRGDSLGLRSQDILHTISGEHISNSFDMFEVLETEEFPMTCTVLRHRTVMAVVTIESCGMEELCGRYTIAGKHNDELLFVNNDKPEYQIFSGDHHNWIIGSFQGGETKEYYMVNIDEEIPPTSHWRVCEHGKKPTPKLLNTEEHLDIPTPPKITKVIPGDGKCTIEFEFDQSTLVPESAPRMKWWYRVEGRHCSQIGYEKSITVTGLKNGEEYQFVVKAESQVMRTCSKLSEVVIPLKKPVAEWSHEGNHYGVRGGDSMVTVYYSDEGTRQNNMRAEYSIDIEGNIFPLQMSPHVIGDLYNGHEYTMSIVASNSVGIMRSSPLTITPLLKPHEPVITYIDETDNSVLLNYQCHRYKDSEINASIVVRTDPGSDIMEPTKKRPIEVTNLITGLPYRFQLIALNTTDITEGAWFTDTFTPMWPPTKPEIIRVSPGHGTIRVFWECNYQCTDAYRPRFKLRTIPGTKEVDIPVGVQAAEFLGLDCGTEYQVIVEAINDNGSSESDPSEKTCPLEYPPAPHSLQITKKKQFLRLKWSSEDLAMPKYDGEYLVWSEPSIGHVLHTSRRQHDFTNLIDGVDYHFYVQSVNAVGSSESAVTGPISLHHKHLIIGSGQFGIEEMVDHLDDTKVLTCLFSISISDIHLVYRFQFIGKYAPEEAKAEALGKHERVTGILGNYDHEMHSFESKSSVTIKSIIDTCRASLSEDSKIAEMTLEKIVTTYHDDMFERKLHYRKSQSKRTPRSSNTELGEDLALEKKRLEEIVRKCRDDDEFVNWVCFSVPHSDLRLPTTNAYGAGSLPQLCEFINRQQFSQSLILIRVLGKDYLLHFTTPSDKLDPIDKLTKNLRPYEKVLSISGTHADLEPGTILSALEIDSGTFFSSLQTHLEHFPPISRRLETDRLIRAKRTQEDLSQIIEKVKDKHKDLNWVLIDPADC